MMNLGSLSNVARLHPGLLRFSRLVGRRDSASRLATSSSSLPSSPVRSLVAASPRPSRILHQSYDSSSANLVGSPLRRPLATVAYRAIGSSTADVNSNSPADSPPPLPPPAGSSSSPIPGTRKKSSSELLDDALTTPSSPPSTSEAEALIVADSCVKRLKDIGETRLRVVVEGGGCSGFQYKFEVGVVIDRATDVVFDKDGVEVVVDESSLELIRGSVVEFHTELIRSAFRISANPLAEKGCSCGASFSVKF